MPSVSPRRLLAKTLVASRRLLRQADRSAFDLCFPPQCLICETPLPSAAGPKAAFCPHCLAGLKLLESPLCPRCAAPLPPGMGPASTCGFCRDQNYAFEATSTLGVYQGGLMEAVLRCKHRAEIPLTLSLGRLLAARTCRRLAGQRIDLVVPMPMHWRRRWSQGVNPPEVLAEPIARRLRAPLALDLLRFRRKISRQASLSPPRRRLNVRKALAVTSAYHLVGAQLLLVDDVLTTGATAHEAARVLRAAGAAAVYVAVAARGIGA